MITSLVMLIVWIIIIGVIIGLLIYLVDNITSTDQVRQVGAIIIVVGVLDPILPCSTSRACSGPAGGRRRSAS